MSWKGSESEAAAGRREATYTNDDGASEGAAKDDEEGEDAGEVGDRRHDMNECVVRECV
jgi:hypothetical protein